MGSLTIMGACMPTPTVLTGTPNGQIRHKPVYPSAVMPAGAFWELVVRGELFSFSGNDYAVTDQRTGLKVFQIFGKTFSISGKRSIHDLTGRQIATIKESGRLFGPDAFLLMQGPRKVAQLEPHERVVFGSRPVVSWTLSCHGKPLYNVTPNGGTRGTTTWTVTDMTGCPLASVSKESHTFTPDNFRAICAPGADAILIFLIVMAIADASEEDSSLW